jgi:hypothetical protein
MSQDVQISWLGRVKVVREGVPFGGSSENEVVQVSGRSC